jgi:hypothetical protein
MSSLSALFGTLLCAASASAATSPASVAYGAVSSAISSNGGSTGAAVSGTTSSGSLPFTGLNLVVILGIAVVMLAIGFTVRIRAAKSN